MDSIGFTSPPGGAALREANKLATTNVTNEIVASLSAGTYGAGGFVRGGFGSVFIIKVLSNESGGGKYKCSAWTPGRSFKTPSGNASSTDFVKGIEHFSNALFINLQEMDLSTHTLTDADNTTQKFFLAVFTGYTSESTPRAVFVGNALWAFTCPAAR